MAKQVDGMIWPRRGFGEPSGSDVCAWIVACITRRAADDPPDSAALRVRERFMESLDAERIGVQGDPEPERIG